MVASFAGSFAFIIRSILILYVNFFTHFNSPMKHINYYVLFLSSVYNTILVEKLFSGKSWVMAITKTQRYLFRDSEDHGLDTPIVDQEDDTRPERLLGEYMSWSIFLFSSY